MLCIIGRHSCLLVIYRSGEEISVVYYRAGYTPNDYPTEKVCIPQSLESRVLNLILLVYMHINCGCLLGMEAYALFDIIFIN